MHKIKTYMVNPERIIPNKLYKYYSINNFFEDVVKTHSCWFSRPQDFNDPFDCVFDVSIGNSSKEIMSNMEKSFMSQFLEEYLLEQNNYELNDGVRKIMENPILLKKIINWVHGYYIDQNIGVYCLSEDPSNILMWSHYANSHKGVCIEYNIPRGGFFYNNLLPVQYKKHYPKFELSDYIGEDNIMFKMHQQVLCTKSVLWKYEKEWRVITDEGYGLKEFNKEDVTKVIFGVKTSDEDKERIISLFKDNGYVDVVFYRCSMSDKAFALNIVEYA